VTGLLFSSSTDQAGAQDDYAVSATRAVLFSSPSLSSRKIGEFRRTAVVTGKETFPGWIEINFPDHGFLQRVLLTKNSRAAIKQEDAEVKKLRRKVKEQAARIATLEGRAPPDAKNDKELPRLGAGTALVAPVEPSSAAVLNVVEKRAPEPSGQELERRCFEMQRTKEFFRKICAALVLRRSDAFSSSIEVFTAQAQRLERDLECPEHVVVSVKEMAVKASRRIAERMEPNPLVDSADAAEVECHKDERKLLGETN